MEPGDATRERRSNRVRRALPLVLILAGAALLRFVNLGYAHFQGDEIKALVPPNATLSDFLLEQRKGPGQFLVTWLVHSIAGTYNELITRIPFALASLASVLIVFVFVRDHWGRAAPLAAALVASCGLLIAFGRIVQYQAFCMLLVLATAWAAFGFAKTGGAGRLYLAAATFGLALLFHYDAVTFAPTLCLLTAVGWRRHRHQRLAPHLAGAFLLAVAIAGLFYVPYVLQPNFNAVADYLQDRVVAGRGMTTFASTRDLLSLYLPPFYVLVLGSGLIAGVAALIRRSDYASLALVFWFVTTFAFYMLLGGDPQSHVYNYFLPGLMIAAYGTWRLVELAGPGRAGGLARAAVWIVVIAVGGVAWTMFVDHRVEHPWYTKSVAGYTLPNLETRKIAGVFGFPYRRGLETVGELFDRGELRGTFNSNERDVMADFYFHSERGDPADYYLYVHQPLSLARDLPRHITKDYRWIRDISFNGRKTIDVYQLAK